MSQQSDQERIQELERLIAALPVGSVGKKTVNGKEYCYHRWTENGKRREKYVPADEVEALRNGIADRKALETELKGLCACNPALAKPSVAKLKFVTNVRLGDALKSYYAPVLRYKKRECYQKLYDYIHGPQQDKVLILYGLRRTGKTTLIRQILANMSAEELSKAALIQITAQDTLASVNQDLKQLEEAGFRYVFLDEVTLMEDFVSGAALFSDVFAACGMKIVLSGTDSLGFWFTLTQELYDRAYTIHTTYIPFREYSRVLGIDSIDEYIRYGGTLQAGELAFDDADALEADAAFRDDESTRRYIDTAICNNIQHSLKCCDRGNYFRHLRSLYEAGELTGAINRIIESMNHQFLLRTLTAPFKSHDLGSAAELLRKQPDEEKRTDILDQIDREAITKKLMELLEIRNQEDARIGIQSAHVAEIKEYLKALDLVVDCPFETTTAEDPEEYVLFTQPGMRYCQAQALVHVLLKDKTFASFSERDKNLTCEKILEDVRGRMMEDIVLLDTARSLPRNKRAFKLKLSRSEFDMVVFDSETNTCEAYEVKHSDEIVERQYSILADEEMCAAAERKCGPITSKNVIYRGEEKMLENGIAYRNVEKYLCAL